MQRGFTDERPDRAIVLDAVRRAVPGCERVLQDETVRALLRIRRDFLDALPIAAAVASRPDGGGADVFEGGNHLFERLAGDALIDGEQRPVTDIVFVATNGLADAIGAFLGSDGETRQFALGDSNVGSRHFVVRLARLKELSGASRRCLVTLVDRTAEVETARSLRAEMLHDSLTGLPNRVAFSEAIDAAIDSGSGSGSFAVLMINLRRFSRINESLGAIAGDELIITVARRLVSSLRPQDFLARTGGDEFGVLLDPIVDDADAFAVVERLQAALSTPFRLCDHEIRIESAVGCALGHTGDAEAEELVRNAQFAMKCAKASGRIETYHPGEARIANRRFAIETELRRTIERDELSLAFQPVIDLSNGRVAGFEALARWHHPDRGEIVPNEFIAVAEEAGLIVPLGRWAIDAAARALAAWRDVPGLPPRLAMAVNVSAVQIAQDDVVGVVAAALARNDLPGERMTLELTESVIINDPESATRTLEGLKALKVAIAMDDFGTGYSSLAYLQRLPIDLLKIDRSFVSGMLGDRDSVAIVRAVLSLADALGMKTVAEGVETVELAQTLNALGCRYAQGFHFARPLSADDALRYALSRNA